MREEEGAGRAGQDAGWVSPHGQWGGGGERAWNLPTGEPGSVYPLEPPAHRHARAHTPLALLFFEPRGTARLLEWKSTQTCEGPLPSARCPPTPGPLFHPFRIPHDPTPRCVPSGTVEARRTYRTKVGAKPVSRIHSGQTPWRSYSGLASPAPRTFPPWRFVWALGRGPVPLPLPASVESASQCPGRSRYQFRGSLGLAVRFTVQETYGTRKEGGRRAGRRGGAEGREGGECAGWLRQADGDCRRWLRAEQCRARSSPRLPEDDRNDLRASPRNLNLRDKTLAFRGAGEHTAVAGSPEFRERGGVARTWRLLVHGAAVPLPVTLVNPEARKPLPSERRRRRCPWCCPATGGHSAVRGGPRGRPRGAFS